MVLSATHGTGVGDFHNFVFDINTAVSNSATEKKLKPHSQHSDIALAIPAAWTAADIAIEVQFNNQTTWYRVDVNGSPLRASGINVGTITLVPNQSHMLLAIPITNMRLRSIATADPWADVLQAAARTIPCFFLTAHA